MSGPRWLAAAARRVPGARGAAARARFGDLSRTAPLGRWGYERGTPVDRWYLERWLAGHALTGRVLEVKDDRYATRLGATAVEVVDVMAGPGVTLVADLCSPAGLPAGRYDGAVVTQTLQFLADPAAAVRHVLEALRPGAPLLLTVPCLSRLDGPADKWRWTPTGLRTLLDACAPGAVQELTGLGNGLAARAFLFGLAAEDLPQQALEVTDADLPLVVVARLAAG